MMNNGIKKKTNQRVYLKTGIGKQWQNRKYNQFLPGEKHKEPPTKRPNIKQRCSKCSKREQQEN